MVGSLLSTLPLWPRMDPLAVLDARRDEDEAGDDFDDEDAELAGLIPDPEPAAPPRTEEAGERPSGQEPA